MCVSLIYVCVFFIPVALLFIILMLLRRRRETDGELTVARAPLLRKERPQGRYYGLPCDAEPVYAGWWSTKIQEETLKHLIKPPACQLQWITGQWRLILWWILSVAIVPLREKHSLCKWGYSIMRGTLEWRKQHTSLCLVTAFFTYEKHFFF